MSEMKNIKTVFSASNEKRLDVLRDQSGKLLLTDDQKKAVLESGHILVSASAGSGKTSTMVKRITLMVAEGASLKDMLVLVYNNAAAEELKERLHQELFRQACSSDGERREHFAKELDELSFCHICTIHAFCQSLIRENFEKLGISPTFEVLDENAHAVYMNKALEEVFSDYYQKNDDEFCDVAEVFLQARKDDNLKNTIIRLYNLLEIQPDGEDFEKCIDECYGSFEHSKFFDILIRWYKGFAKRALGIFEQLYEAAKDSEHIQNHVLNLVNAITVCHQMLKANDFCELCRAALSFEKLRFQKSKQATEIEVELADKIKEYVNQFSDIADELSDAYEKYPMFESWHCQNAKYVRKLLEIVKSFSETLKALKNKDNVLSFEDLQHKAMELLSAEEYGVENCFDAVFVDEYQDVNPLQEEIIRRLIKDECFIVGDVKQSIYGFRLADPAIFISRQLKYECFAQEGTNIYFNHNFRSAYSILKFVNGVFDAVMTSESADINYKKDARFELNAIPPVTLDGVSPEGYVQVHLFVKPKAATREVNGLYDITNHPCDESEDKNSANEGRFIAKEIKSLVGRAKGVDENGNGKYIGYGDIAILFRSRSKGAQEILDELSKAGIPVNDSAFSKTVSLPEREIIAMLRVLDNPRQDIPLAGFLLSFLGGYDEGELAEISACDGECFYDRFLCRAKERDTLGVKIKRTLNMLDDYRLKSSFESVANLMSEIVRDFSYDAYLMRKGEAEVYGLKSFVASAKSQNVSLGEFLENYSEGESAGVSSGGGDRVTVSTFHGYKGLENPIVFIADTAYGFNYKASSGDLIASGKGIGSAQSSDNFKGLVGMSAFDFENKVKCPLTLSKLAVAKCIRDNQIKEEIRLFYVALTRAKQLMYVTATVSENKEKDFGATPKLTEASCDLDFISTAIYEQNVSVPVFRHTDESEKTSEVSGAVLPKPNRAIEERIRKAQSFEYPYKQSTTLAMKYSVSALDSIDEQTVRIYREGANIGTSYHKVMQNIDYFAKGVDAVRAEMERLLCENLITQEEKDAVSVQDILRCLESDIMEKARQTILKQGRCLREQAFMMYKSARDVSDGFQTDDKVLVQGVIDLFIDGDEKIIVDFKYSMLNDKDMLIKYKKQLELYKKAVESTFSVKIDKIMLYSFKTGNTVEF